MKARSFARDLAVFTLWAGSSLAGVSVQDPNFAVELIYSGNGMVPMEFGPNGFLFVGEKAGKILLFKPDGAGGYLAPTVFANLESAVGPTNEMGLLGLALHPDFANNRWLYVYHTTPAGEGRLARMTANASYDRAVDQPTTLLDIAASGGTSHKAGDLHFSPADSRLYLTLGNGYDGSGTGLSTYDAKLLRLDDRGLGLSDNPFFDGDVNSVKSRVWGFNCRNPFRFTFHPVTYVMYVAENGGGTDRITRWEAGGDGAYSGGNFLNPADPRVTNLATPAPSITGIAIVRGGPFGDPQDASVSVLYAANWRNGYVQRWRMTGSNLDGVDSLNIGGDNRFITGGKWPFVAHLLFGPDGALYMTTTPRSVGAGALYRVRFVGGTPPTGPPAIAFGTLVVDGTVSDPTVTQVLVAGVATTVTQTRFRREVPITANPQTIAVTTADRTGSTTRALNVTAP